MDPRSGPRLALLVGIDRYRHLPAEESLRGAVRDAEGMADLLEDRFRFPASGIRLLRDAEACRGTVLRALEDLVEQVEPGAVVVIHWSGHGSRSLAPATGGSGATAGPGELEETLVPHDSRGGGVRDLRDKELLLPLSRLAAGGARVTWIADSCHSGHLYRDSRFGRARRIADDPRAAPHAPPAPGPPVPGPGAGLRSWMANRPHQVLLAACRADQEAFERPLVQREAHGEWTFALLRILRDCPAGATARQVADAARLRLLAEDVPQSPQAVGARDRRVFGVEARPPVRFVEVRRAGEGRVELAGGQAQGLVEGSLWSVHPAGTLDPQPHGAPAVRLVRVGALSSEAQVQGEADRPAREIEPGDRAFETVPAYGELRLGVRLSRLPPEVPAATDPLVRTLGEHLSRSPVLRACSADEKGGVTVEVGPTGCRLLDDHGFALAEDLPLDDPGTPVRVVQRLERRARWRHGLLLENRDRASRITPALHARLLRRDGSGNWRTAAGPEGDEAIPVYRCGDLLALEISHDLPAELCVYVLDFGLDDDVSQLFPPPGGLEWLGPGAPLRPGTIPGDELTVWLPGAASRRNRGAGTGYLKVFATTGPVDLDWLRTDVRWPQSLRDHGSSLASLLSMGAEGPVYRSHDEDWGTLLLPMRVRP